MAGASDDLTHDLGIGPGTLARVVGESLDLLEDRMRDHAAANDGSVQLRDLRAIRNQVDPGKDEELLAIVKSGWKDLASAAEREFWANQRKFPLERLIVHRFDNLLAPKDHAPRQHATLSRRVIPAFLSALQQMVGPELFEEYESRCKKIVEKTREKLGDAFTWDVVYDDPSAHVLVTDILVYISRYFDDMERRRHWMIDIFERYMPAGKTDDERAWHFDSIEFHLMMDALFQDLQRGISDPQYAARLKKRYGNANLASVEILLDNLAVDRRSVSATAKSDTFL